MSGNSHQRKVVETTVASALKKLGLGSLPTNSPTPDISSSPKQLGRGSLEAYAFFIVAGIYTVMSAFGSPVNFWAGCFMALVMGVCAGHLLWSSVWTSNWARLAKIAGSGLISVTVLIVINLGFVETHRVKNPNSETLSAIQNLGELINHLGSQQGIQERNTQVFDVDGKYPNISLSEPREITVPGGAPLVNVDYINDGTATAYAKRHTAGIFIAKRGKESEDAIFGFLYEHEADRDKNIPVEDLSPRGDGIIPIGGEVLTEDGQPAKDADRTDLATKNKVLYIALLVGYQDRKGRQYHTELCFFSTDAKALVTKCNSHNGHG
jgi:hypothetical protein